MKEDDDDDDDESSRSPSLLLLFSFRRPPLMCLFYCVIKTTLNIPDMPGSGNHILKVWFAAINLGSRNKKTPEIYFHRLWKLQSVESPLIYRKVKSEWLSYVRLTESERSYKNVWALWYLMVYFVALNICPNPFSLSWICFWVSPPAPKPPQLASLNAALKCLSFPHFFWSVITTY